MEDTYTRSPSDRPEMEPKTPTPAAPAAADVDDEAVVVVVGWLLLLLLDIPMID